MRRTVTGVFKSLQQAEQALDKIELSGYANNQISMVLKKSHDPNFGIGSEYAEEITGDPAIGMLHDFDSFLVQADNIELPVLGKVIAGGPLAGALIQGDKPLAVALTYYGISAEHAAEIENFVNDGYVLAVIETNNSKANEVTNILSGFGAHMVERWSKSIDHPIRPWN